MLIRDNIKLKNTVLTKQKTLKILIPQKWSLLLLRVNTKSYYLIYLFSNLYYFKFSLPQLHTNISFCNNTNILTLSGYQFKPLNYIWVKELNLILSILNSFFFNKLKFKGKGYYIYKNLRNTIAPQFGYYHRIYIYSFFNRVKFLSKTKLLIFGMNKSDVITISSTIKDKRKINIFTSRGVRFARQIIYKKTGKVSSYR